MPRVSVVVPSYNNADHIAATLRSILDQTFGDFELLVADHSSTDGTLDVVSTFTSDSRVTLLNTSAGGGAPRNWNRVSQAATGDLIKLVCADDVLQPHGLQTQVAALDDEPRAVMAASPRRIVDEAGKPLFGKRGLGGMSGLVEGRTAIRRLVRAGTNVMGEPVCVTMRRPSLEAVGWWDASFPFVIDQTTYVNVLGTGALVAVPEVVADFRISAGQWSVALAKQQFQQVAQFHRWVSEAYPSDVSAADVRIGNARAWRTAAGRRATYWWLARRRSR